MKSLICKTEINKSKIHGWGVFAKHNIAKGGVIEESPFLKTFRDNNKNHKCIRDYVFGWRTHRDQNLIPLGHGALCNHSYSPNAECKSNVKRNLFVFIAKRKIKRGEEILIEYEESYWRWRKIKPKKINERKISNHRR